MPGRLLLICLCDSYVTGTLYLLLSPLRRRKLHACINALQRASTRENSDGDGFMFLLGKTWPVVRFFKTESQIQRRQACSLYRSCIFILHLAALRRSSGRRGK